MYDLRVARAGVGADALCGLQDDHLAAVQSQCARDGEPYHPGTDHSAFDLLGHARSPRPLQAGSVGIV